MLSSELPSLTIGKDVRKYVAIESFDASAYAEYLHGRHIPDEEIAKVSLIVTNEQIRFMAKANYTREQSGKDTQRVIRFSPTRIANDAHEQGNMLRHETEHLIHDIKWPFGEKLRVAEVLAVAAAGGIMFGMVAGKSGYETARQAAQHAPEAVRTAAEVMGTAAMGIPALALGGWVTLEGAKMYGPWELLAVHAQKKQRAALPDRTLRFAYAR